METFLKMLKRQLTLVPQRHKRGQCKFMNASETTVYQTVFLSRSRKTDAEIVIV